MHVASTGDGQAKNDRLIDSLMEILGPDHVITDVDERAFYAADVYAVGETPAAVIQPKDKESCAKAVAAATRAGYAVVPRGAGLSYTGGYSPVREDTVTIDTTAMNRILEINEDDLYITVEAGVTWKQIYEALDPLGLRLPFFGTFSGRRATVGGGLSNGALFMGTCRYGTAAEIVQCIEVVLADGTLLKTGQPGFENVTKPFYRTYGPDLTGLFVHDCGTLGVKVQATLRLMKKPVETEYASYCFPNAETTAKALSDIARSGAAEEAYVFDPDSTRKGLTQDSVLEDLKTLTGVFKRQSGWLKGLKEGASLVVAGRDFLTDGAFSLHVVVSGNCKPAVETDLKSIRDYALKSGGEEIPNSIPKAVRANPFKPLNSVIGPYGDRWAALNGKVAHSDAQDFIKEVDAVLDRFKERMDSFNMYSRKLMIAVGQHSFSYEPIIHWYDSWNPIHRRSPEPQHLKKLKEPEPDPEAAALAAEIRSELISVFQKWGAASNQIGKSYPYFESLRPETAKVVGGLKAMLDPDNLLNPGGLGFK